MLNAVMFTAPERTCDLKTGAANGNSYSILGGWFRSFGPAAVVHRQSPPLVHIESHCSSRRPNISGETRPCGQCDPRWTESTATGEPAASVRSRAIRFLYLGYASYNPQQTAPSASVIRIHSWFYGCFCHFLNLFRVISHMIHLYLRIKGLNSR